MEVRPSKKDKKSTPEVELKPLPSHLRIEKALIIAHFIQPPNWSLPSKIMCDASDYAVGGFWGNKEMRSLMSSTMLARR